jgi:hypothetical protein
MSAAHDYDDYDDTDCPNCGGEGVYYDCFDGCCLDAEYGCELCERRCDWCSPSSPLPEPPQGEK